MNPSRWVCTCFFLDSHRRHTPQKPSRLGCRSHRTDTSRDGHQRTDGADPGSAGAGGGGGGGSDGRWARQIVSAAARGMIGLPD